MTNITSASLAQNFGRVVRCLQDDGLGTTNIAKMIGYTSTTQLTKSIEDKSLLSTKAILTMIERLNVNPIYLFLGKGEMFLSEEDEPEFTKLYKSFNALNKQYNDSLETIKKLKERNSILEKMTRNLLADTAEFMKSVTESENEIEDQEVEESNQDIK